MESLNYIDTLFKEYLLFRGFTTTLQTFNSDLAADRGCGFQVCTVLWMFFVLEHYWQEYTFSDALKAFKYSPDA